MAASYPLPVFIRKNLGSITEEWRDFAETIAEKGTSDLVLRDHIHPILFFIADDIETRQTARQQRDKSQGKKDIHKISPGAIHAELRQDLGFDMAEMVSEYRALRATVTKLWTKTRLVLTDADVLDLIRFNEAIDQLIAHSIKAFIKKYMDRPNPKNL
jgi:hypothetical protein